MTATLARPLDGADSALDRDLRETKLPAAGVADLRGRTRLHRPARSPPAPRPILSGSLSARQAERVLAQIEARLDLPLRLAELAATARLSSSHFCRAFKVSFGHPPHAYVMRMRVERAKRLMLDDTTSLAEIALSCGLSDQTHLSRMFRKIVGESPNAWRRQHCRLK